MIQNNDEFNYFNEENSLNEFNDIGKEQYNVNEFKINNTEIIEIKEINKNEENQKTIRNNNIRMSLSKFNSYLKLVGTVAVVGTIATAIVAPQPNPQIEIINQIITENSITLNTTFTDLSDDCIYIVSLENSNDFYLEQEVFSTTTEISFIDLESSTTYLFSFINQTDQTVYYQSTFTTKIHYTEDIVLNEAIIGKYQITFDFSFTSLNPEHTYNLSLSNETSNYEQTIDLAQQEYSFTSLTPNTSYQLSIINQDTNQICYSDSFITKEANTVKVNNVFVNVSNDQPYDLAYGINVILETDLEPDVIVNAYLVKDNEIFEEYLDLRTNRITFNNIDINNDYQIIYELEQAGSIIKTANIDVSTTPPTDTADYYFYASNPGDVMITLNDDETYNAYIYTGMQVNSTTFDDIIYEIELESINAIEYSINDSVSESVTKLYYTGQDQVVSFLDLDLNQSYILKYSVYGIKDNIGYLLSYTYPSGVIEPCYEMYELSFIVDRINQTAQIELYQNLSSDLLFTVYYEDQTTENFTITKDQINEDNNICLISLKDYSGYQYSYTYQTLVELYETPYEEQIRATGIFIKGTKQTIYTSELSIAMIATDLRLVTTSFDQDQSTLNLDFIEYQTYGYPIKIELYAGDTNIYTVENITLVDGYYSDIYNEWLSRYTITDQTLNQYETITIKYSLQNQDLTTYVTYEDTINLTN